MRLLLASSLLLGAGALWMVQSRRPLQDAPVGVDPVLLDTYGEPEPELSWFDLGTYYETFKDISGMTTTAYQDAPELRYFSAAEFGDWWGRMDVDLLRKLDKFRALWGQPVQVSQVPGALGRYAGASNSYHNIERWDAVRAVDIFPQGLTSDNAEKAVQLAEEAGLGGIGVYTDTQPSMMMHVDNRETAGRWSRIDGEYRGISDAYA